MSNTGCFHVFSKCLVALALLSAPQVSAAEPSAQLLKALSYKPRQSGVLYEQVSREEIANCTIEETVREDGKGFLITGKGGQPLRWFADTNRDNQLDKWCYFNAGVEVYRESDTDFNSTADEYRWLSTEGLRRGIDKNEDGEIDSWAAISAEEVSFEVVGAASGKDAGRFSRLLISASEIDALGLGEEKEQLLKQRVADARKQFESWASGQNVVTTQSRWTNFGADKPGVVPAGTDGSKKDIVVYENAVALLDDNGQAKQLLVGTLIRVGDAWRIVDLPKAISEGAVVSDGGVFFSASFSPRGTASQAELSGGISKAMERLVSDLQEIDSKLATAGNDGPQLQSRRADVLEKLVSESAGQPEDRSTWIKQFADTVSAAAQTGEYPGGVKRMQDFAGKLSSVNASDGELSYVVFRMITADHNEKMQQPKANYEELQKSYLENLEAFVTKYPKSPDAAEAMIQMGLSAEFSGEMQDAKSWYARASQGFEGSLAGRKATGALRRLNLQGQAFALQGTRIEGGKFDSASYLGGPVIYHGWASWCQACEAEMKALKALQAKYAKSKLRLVGINFDNSSNLGLEYLKKNAFPWAHLYEPGGLDNDIAVSNGILSLPANIIVDRNGRVVATGVHHTELDEIIADLVE